jgi:ketosteroid isomerase-like protein
MATTEHEVLQQEQRLADAKRTLDLEAVDSIYADDLLMSGVMGEPTCSKGAILDEVRRGIAQRDTVAGGGPPVDVSTANEDLKVVVHGDTAVANYRFVVTIKGPNRDVKRRYRTTNVWMKRRGQWQIVAAHMAFVLDPEQAAMLAGEASR